MPSYNAICLCTITHTHQLDHLAPLANLLEIPLILTDPLVYKTAQHFYPFTHLIYMSGKDCSLDFLSRNYDVIFLSCKHCGRELGLTIKQLFNRSIRFFYCPHGNSDKGHLHPENDLLKDQDLSLVYGHHMKDMLSKRGILQSLQGTVTTGNYRYNYYLKHKEFYDHLAQKEVLSKFKTKQTTILYAPTWQDHEKSSSFLEVCKPLIEQLPNHYNLIIKLHPNLEDTHTSAIYSLIGKYETLPNVVFLSQYPPVYPILNQVDLYLGDFSSVGYDFLAFNKPMLFFNSTERNATIDAGLFLFRCGEVIPKSAYYNLYPIIEHHLNHTQKHLSPLREEIYHYTFAKDRAPSVIQQDILELLKTTQPLY